MPSGSPRLLVPLAASLLGALPALAQPPTGAAVAKVQERDGKTSITLVGPQARTAGRSLAIRALTEGAKEIDRRTHFGRHTVTVQGDRAAETLRGDAARLEELLRGEDELQRGVSVVRYREREQTRSHADDRSHSMRYTHTASGRLTLEGEHASATADRLAGRATALGFRVLTVKPRWRSGPTLWFRQREVAYQVDRGEEAPPFQRLRALRRSIVEELGSQAASGR